MANTKQKSAPGFTGWSILNLKARGLDDRHPTEVWKFDQEIRKWTNRSARSNIIVGG